MEEEKKKCNRNCTHDSENVLCGGEGVENFYGTGSNLPGPVQNLIVNFTTEDKIVLLFDHPERNGTELTDYEARAIVLSTYSIDPWAMRNITKKIPKLLHKIEFDDLIPSTEYNISIVSLSDGVEGGIKSVIAGKFNFI